MAESMTFKSELLALMKREDLGNKLCVDCSAPNPQWASIPYGIYICLSCAGLHRGLGVHISFVRSITMDEWSNDQMKKMRSGGNGPFMEFMRSYTPADQGGYREGMNVSEKYNCWAATQYREKLSAEVEGKPWSASAPPADAISGPSSAQGLRKSRTGTRGAVSPSPLRQGSGSPAPFDEATEQRSANERFFAGLGEANSSRPDHLPPSQGGKYTGFGSTPEPSYGYGSGSGSVPSLDEIRQEPLAAVSKGWSLLSSVVAAASRTVVDHATDPNLHAQVRGYVSTATQAAGSAAGQANEWSKKQFGVDVVDSLGTIKDRVVDAAGINKEPAGYSSVRQDGYGYSGGLSDDDGTRLYNDGGDDDFFDRHGGNNQGTTSGNYTHQAPTSAAGGAVQKKKDDWNDDDWKDF